LVSEGKCLLKNNKGQHTIYLKLKMANDTAFPFPLGTEDKRNVKVYFNDKNQLIIEEWKGSPKQYKRRLNNDA